MAFTKITAAGIDTSGTITTQSISVSGVSTVGSLSIGATSVISSARQLQNIASLDATTTATIESAVANAPNTFTDLSVSGISTLGVTSATNLTAQSLNVSGIITATQLSTGASGTGVNISTDTISGPATLTIDPAAVGDNTGAVRIKGDLYVDGTQFIVNSTTIELADFNVGIASTVGTNALLDGAGIGIGSIGIRKTLTWNNSSTALKSSEDFDISSGKVYRVNGTSVLSNNTLGSGVVNSSLTSVGTLGQLQVTGISTFTNGPILVGSATSTGTASQPLQVTGGAYVSGNLGVGVASPAYNLDVNGTANITTQISLWGKTIGQPQTLIEPGKIYATSAGLGPGDLLLQSTGGNLGIGLTNPAKKLHVQTSFVSGAARGGGFTQILFESNQAAATYWEFQANASSTNDILFSKSGTGGSSYGVVGYDHATEALRFYTNSNERLRIDSSGMVTKPYQPAWNLRPNGNSSVTTTTNDNFVGWSNNTSGSSAKLCHIQGVTLTGSSSGIHGATSSGRINFPVAGRYKVWCTIRCENNPGTGNIYLFINGVSLARQHVEGWRSTGTVTPYTHGFHSQIINVAANDYLEIQMSVTAGAIISGYNDVVNWCGGYLIG